MEAQIHASELQTSAFRSERLPKLSFVGDNGWIGNGWDHLLHTYDWGLQVSVPLFTGLRTRSQVEEQRAQTGALQAQRRELREQVEFMEQLMPNRSNLLEPGSTESNGR